MINNLKHYQRINYLEFTLTLYANATEIIDIDWEYTRVLKKKLSLSNASTTSSVTSLKYPKKGIVADGERVVWWKGFHSVLRSNALKHRQAKWDLACPWQQWSGFFVKGQFWFHICFKPLCYKDKTIEGNMDSKAHIISLRFKVVR